MALLSRSTSARKGAKPNLQHKMVQMMYPHMKVNAGLSQAGTSNPPRQRCNWLLMLLRYMICFTNASSLFCSLRRTLSSLLHWQECQSMPCVLTLPKHWLPEMNICQYLHTFCSRSLLQARIAAQQHFCKVSFAVTGNTPHCASCLRSRYFAAAHSADTSLIHLQQSQQPCSCFVAPTP